MNRKTTAFVITTLTAGLLLILAGSLIPHSPATLRPQTEQTETTLKEIQGEFTNVNIDVQAADIQILQGKEFSIQYHLDEKEKIITAQIDNGTLTLITEPGLGWHPGRKKGQVIITLPEQQKLNQVDLNTVSGTVTLEQITMDTGNIRTTSGQIRITDTEADHLDAENKTGALSISGMVNTISLHSISGSLTLQGQVNTSASLETVSGKIEVEAPFNTVHAESMREITVNGQKQGRQFNFGKDSPQLNVKSVSGKIRLDLE